MLIFILALGIGFLLLMWSANTFADKALQLGLYLNISKILIGIVILGFGTSAPELLVSALSALQGNAGLAIGNAIGSNITNILLVLGATLCVLAIQIDADLIRKNFFLLLAATTLFSLLIIDKQLSFVDGAILASALILTLYILSRFETNDEHDSADQSATDTDTPISNILAGLLIGLIVLLGSSKLVVWSATQIAQHLGVSDLIIGLTIVALGTSLPELATCIASALKKHSELALGNIVGSNIFNTLGVTATASLITTYKLPEQIFSRDYPIMILATGILFALVLLYSRKKYIPRGFGLFFIAAYAAYMLLIFNQAR